MTYSVCINAENETEAYEKAVENEDVKLLLTEGGMSEVTIIYGEEIPYVVAGNWDGEFKELGRFDITYDEVFLLTKGLEYE